MDYIKECKENLIKGYESLSQERQADLQAYYDTRNPVHHMIQDAKREAESVMNYADRHDYGYGEVGYNLNESVKDFAESVPELEKSYKRLLNAYFDFLTEAKNI